MKRFLAMCLVVAAVATFTGCGSSAEDTKTIGGGPVNTGTSSGSTAAVSGYVFSYQGMDITVDSDASVYTDKLGEPTSYFESPSCAGEGIGKLYTYEDIEIQTYPDGDKDLVLYVMLRNDKVSTQEGIDLSNSFEDVKAAYGEPNVAASGSLVYEKDGMKLIFLFDGADMISIEYDSSKN